MQANKSCDITLYENISLNGKIGMNLQNIHRQWSGHIS